MQKTTAQVRQLEAAIVVLEQEDPRDQRQTPRGLPDRSSPHAIEAREALLRHELREAQARETNSELFLQKTTARLRHFEALAEECERLHKNGRPGVDAQRATASTAASRMTPRECADVDAVGARRG